MFSHNLKIALTHNMQQLLLNKDYVFHAIQTCQLHQISDCTQ